jgi:hypothetical protein
LNREPFLEEIAAGMRAAGMRVNITDIHFLATIPFMAIFQVNLTPREQKVLAMRFGLEDGFTHSREETGKAFLVTQERIKQIEDKALEKFREGFLRALPEEITEKFGLTKY